MDKFQNFMEKFKEKKERKLTSAWKFLDSGKFIAAYTRS